MTQNREIKLRGAGVARRLLALVMAVALLAMCGVAALAEGGACTLTVVFERVPSGTVEVGLYKADPNDFKDLTTDDDLRAAAINTAMNGSPIDTKSLDTSTGKVVFTGLEPGYYVGLQVDSRSDDYLAMNPFVVDLQTVLTISAKVEVASWAEVTKNWAEDEGHTRPTDVIVKLQSDQSGTMADVPKGVYVVNDVLTEITGGEFTLNEGNSWHVTVTGLPRAVGEGSGARLIKYQWVEQLTDGAYTSEIVYTNKDGEEGEKGSTTLAKDSIDYKSYSAVITNTFERTQVTVTKQWEDNDDEYRMRPAEIKLNLKANGETVDTATVKPDEDGQWSYTWDRLQKLDEFGKEIKYTVTEDAIKGSDGGTIYTPADSTAEDGTLVITNTYTPETTYYDVIKVWADSGEYGDNQDGIRPDSITVNLMQDGKVYKENETLTPDEEGNWTKRWNDLPKYRDQDQLIVYTVQEVNVPEGYELVSTQDDQDELTTTITNRHVPETVSTHIEKLWNDDDNRDGVRPDTITATLTGTPEGSAEAVYTQEFELTAADNWQLDVDDLSKYADGKLIKYAWQESSVADYTTTPATIKRTEGDKTYVEIENAHEIDTVEVAVTKRWVPATPTTPITVRLYKNGAPDADHAPLTLSPDNNYTDKWTDLPKNENGVAIVYTVVEETTLSTYVVENPTAEDDEDQESDNFSYTITNTYNRGSLSITKNVTMNGAATDTTVADGVYTFTVTYPSGETTTVSISVVNGVGGSTTLNNLEPGTYTVTETVPANMTVSANNQSVTVVANETASVSFTNDIAVTPTPTPTPVPTVTPTPEITPTPVPTTSVEGVKIWNDENNIHGVRPSSITVTLYANGVPAAYTPTWSGTDTNNWSYVFSGLPAVDATGAEITYTVAEVGVPGYVTVISGTTILNDLIPQTPEEYADIDGEKQWSDGGNADGVRPNYITVTLYQDGVPIATRTVTAANGWQYTFQGMPVDDGYGHIYEYTVEESTVPGYISIVNGTTILNMRIPGDTPPGDTPPGDTPPEEPPRNTPPFEEFSEEELEELVDLFDYGTPLFGRPLGTGDELPLYPFIFAGIGLAAVLILVLTGRRKGRKA